MLTEVAMRSRTGREEVIILSQRGERLIQKWILNDLGVIFTQETGEYKNAKKEHHE